MVFFRKSLILFSQVCLILAGYYGSVLLRFDLRLGWDEPILLFIFNPGSAFE